MNPEASPLAAAVPGLVRSDPHGPGLTRVRDTDGVRYLDPAGAEITDAATLGRIQALRIPPAWADVWISPDPAGHIQATGTDSKGRLSISTTGSGGSSATRRSSDTCSGSPTRCPGCGPPPQPT